MQLWLITVGIWQSHVSLFTVSASGLKCHVGTYADRKLLRSHGKNGNQPEGENWLRLWRIYSPAYLCIDNILPAIKILPAISYG